jgi:signal transduction histidine kinase
MRSAAAERVSKCRQSFLAQLPLLIFGFWLILAQSPFFVWLAVRDRNLIAHQEVPKVASLRARREAVLVIFGFLLFFAVLDTINNYVGSRGEGLPVNRVVIYYYGILFWAPFFIAVPGVLLSVDRFPLESWRSGKSLFVQAIAGLVFTYLHLSFISIVSAYVEKIRVVPRLFESLRYDFAVDYLGYCGMVAAGYALQHYSEFARRESEARLEERIRERMRIARDLHDTLLQSFQGLMLRFQAVDDMLPARPSEAKEALEGALDRADQAISESRDAIADMRTPMLASHDLAKSMTALMTHLTEELATSNKSSVTFRVLVEGAPRTVRPNLQDEIYRIARESLRNAFRHAQARHIETEITYGESLRVRFRDDGKGIDPSVLEHGGRSGHWGLPGMRERAKHIGAQLKVWSEHGAGTEIELSIPGSLAYEGFRARSRFRLFRKRTEEDHEQRS